MAHDPTPPRHRHHPNAERPQGEDRSQGDLGLLAPAQVAEDGVAADPQRLRYLLRPLVAFRSYATLLPRAAAYTLMASSPDSTSFLRPA